MSSALEAGEALTLPESEAHHVSKVLRGRVGDTFEVVDSGGRLFIAEIRERDEAIVTGELATSAGMEIEVSLYQAVPKGRHMDLVFEKATELGVSRVAPLVTDRGVVKLDGEAKAGRWRRVAEAAARQSLQLRVPEVSDPMPFSEAVAEAGDNGILLHNAAGLEQIEGCVEGRAVSLLVGPEGGWSEGEIRLAEEAGMRMAQLGPYRLRSETAGIVAVARARAALERLSREAGL